MSKPDEEREEETTGPGAVARRLIPVLDAGIQVLQRLRSRLGGSDDESSDDRRSSGPAREAADEGAAASGPSLLLRLAIALLLLIVGLAVGGYLSYRMLSLQLEKHGSVVERMQEELDAARKEDARNVKLLDKFQRENAEYRLDARDAQRAAEKAERHAEELEAQIEEMKRAEQATQQPRRATPPTSRASQRAPLKSGNCAVGSAEEMSACIEKFNQQ